MQPMCTRYSICHAECRGHPGRLRRYALLHVRFLLLLVQLNFRILCYWDQGLGLAILIGTTAVVNRITYSVGQLLLNLRD